jgi:hypothetical protein
MSAILAVLMCAAFGATFVSLYRGGKAPIFFTEIERKTEPMAFAVVAILISSAAAFVVFVILQPFGV